VHAEATWIETATLHTSSLKSPPLYKMNCRIEGTPSILKPISNMHAHPLSASLYGALSETWFIGVKLHQMFIFATALTWQNLAPLKN
jgi:hypothetical protein